MNYQKKARTVLGALVVLTLVGSTFAFQAQKATRSGKLHCTDEPGACPDTYQLKTTNIPGVPSYCTTTGTNCTTTILVTFDQ